MTSSKGSCRRESLSEERSNIYAMNGCTPPVFSLCFVLFFSQNAQTDVRQTVDSHLIRFGYHVVLS